MAYRFAAAVGVASLLAQSVVALPQDVVVTRWTTVQAGAAPTQAPAAHVAPVNEKEVKASATAAPAPVKSAVTAAPAAANSATSSASTSTDSTDSTASGAVAGLCVNTAANGVSYASSIISANAGKIGWYHNWSPTSSGIKGASFYPMLHDFGEEGEWKNVVADYALGYNELDQAGILGPEACEHYKSAFLPGLSGNTKAVAPSFTSTANTANMGISWLQGFMSACGSATIDACQPHYYFYPKAAGLTPEDFYPNSDSFNSFTSFIESAHSTCNGKPLIVSELGLDPNNEEGYSAAQHGAFLKTAGDWLASQPYVLGYGAFEAGNAYPTDLQPNNDAVTSWL